MDLAISDRSALVLGGSRGLGKAIARSLAAEGVRLVIASRSADALKAAAREIAGAGRAGVVPMAADATDPDSLTRLFEEAERQLGGVDILVNNHGGPPLGRALELDEAELIAQFTPVVVSVIRLTSLAVGPMRRRGWGRILTVGSSGMIQPLPNMALSNTLRAAVMGYMKTLATEVAPDGVTVNVLAPGKIATDRTRGSNEANAERLGITPEEVEQRNIADIPLGRYGRPDELGALAAFLCSEAAGFMTGSLWRVEGGLIRSIA